MPRYRVGVGFDAHAFADGRPLMLGGVQVPYAQGLAGHSDADVLIHAIIDAMLGGAALGDIGAHFPSSRPEYAGIASLFLLEQTRDLLANAGWQVLNIDATIIAERPRLAEFIPGMRDAVSKALGIDRGAVSIKATTTDGLGDLGRGAGIAAHAVCMLEERSSVT